MQSLSLHGSVCGFVLSALLLLCPARSFADVTEIRTGHYVGTAKIVSTINDSGLKISRTERVVAFAPSNKYLRLLFPAGSGSKRRIARFISGWNTSTSQWGYTESSDATVPGVSVNQEGDVLTIIRSGGHAGAGLLTQSQFTIKMRLRRTGP